VLLLRNIQCQREDGGGCWNFEVVKIHFLFVRLISIVSAFDEGGGLHAQQEDTRVELCGVPEVHNEGIRRQCGIHELYEP
jgi:hypothetical protein